MHLPVFSKYFSVLKKKACIVRFFPELLEEGASDNVSVNFL
jgi:hypothetical protein